MATKLRMKLTSVLLCLSLFCNGCALPHFNRNTTSVQLSALSHGITQRQVTKTLKTNGEPIFSFTESGDAYHCKAFFATDTGVFYYLLWINGELASICHSKENDWLPLISAFHDSARSLPHEDGFATLKEHFVSPYASIDAIEFSFKKPGYRSEPPFGRRGEFLMWLPIMVLFLPLTIPSICWGNLIYSKMYRLRLGMSSARVLWTAGTPEQIIGDEDGYGIWVYRRTTVSTEGETITVSVGMKSKTVVWIRYYYDAVDDYSRHTTSG